MKRTSGVLGGALLTVVSATTLAQQVSDQAAVSQLGVIEVQGDALAPLPEGSTRVTRTELDDRSIESWEDFGRRGSAAVNFNRGSDSVNVRGMDGDRVSTRIDGIRLPWLTDGARGVQGGLSSVDFGSLSSVDLVGGVGAVSSGSLTGYLNLRTLQPDDLLPPGQDFGALLKTGYGSSDEGWDGRMALAGRLPNQSTKWLFQAGLRRGHELENMGTIGGYGSARDKTNPENTRQHNLLLKLQHELNAEHQLTLSGESFQSRRDIDNMRTQGTGTSFFEGMNETSVEQKRERVWAGWAYRSSKEQAAIEYADFKAYWQKSQLDENQGATRRRDGRGNIPFLAPYGYAFPYGPYGRDNHIQERSHGVVGEWGGTLATANLTHRWSMGAEWYSSRSEQNASGYDNCPANLAPVPGWASSTFGPRSCDLLHTNQQDIAATKGNTYALWLQDEISWADGRYAAVPALRYDHYRYSPDTGGFNANNPNADYVSLSRSSGGRFSPSFMLKAKPADNLSLYAKYGYGFKAPSSTQLYMSFGGPAGYLVTGNPNLRPEVSRGWELGLEYGNARRGLQLAVFENRYRDFIDSDVALTENSPEWRPEWSAYPMGVRGYANRSRVRIYGAELSGQWAFNNHWYTWGSVAWAHGRDQDTNEYINSVAPLRAIVGVGYRQQQWGAEAVTTLARHRNKVTNPETDFQAPGYGLLDLSAWWAPQVVKGMKLQAGVYNVFDKTYWNALNVSTGGRDSAPVDYYTEPGRSFRISLSYQY